VTVCDTFEKSLKIMILFRHVKKGKKRLKTPKCVKKVAQCDSFVTLLKTRKPLVLLGFWGFCVIVTPFSIKDLVKNFLFI